LHKQVETVPIEELVLALSGLAVRQEVSVGGAVGRATRVVSDIERTSIFKSPLLALATLGIPEKLAPKGGFFGDAREVFSGTLYGAAPGVENTYNSMILN